MADIRFKIPQRYDMGIAQQGVFFEVVDKEDNHYGEFKCRHIDQDSPAYKKKQEQISLELQRGNRNAKVSDEKLITEIFIKAVLVDWKGILDENDKPVPFNEKNARDYFDQPFTQFVRSELMAQAQESHHYKLANKGDVAGN